MLRALDRVAERHGSTPAAIALVWSIVRQSVAAPIASATSVEQLKSFANAVELALSAGDIRELDAASTRWDGQSGLRGRRGAAVGLVAPALGKSLAQSLNPW
ncbi:aldo/keto reductase [Paraburkholderia sp. Cy-641]|nr:aldo/keto reductase [Paraburkholderia sp. Cy-641]